MDLSTNTKVFGPMPASSPRVGLDGDVDGMDGKTSPELGQKFATLQIHTSSKQSKPRPPDQLPHTALMAVNKAMSSLWLYHSCFLHYRLNSYSKFQRIPTKNPTTPTSYMLKSHKITETTGCHSCSQPAVRPRLPPPTTLFQLKLKKTPSVCYILPEVGAWSNIITTSKLE